MPGPNKLVLSRRAVDALPVAGREALFWDRDLTGFGVRVHPSGSKVYMVQTRTRGKTRRVTIGRHGVWTPERARREAGRLLASLKAGETPSRPGADSPSANGPTIAEMAERYMTEHVAVRCKPTTQRGCRHILDRFLLPKFGALRLSEVTPDHVAALHYRMRATPTMANQAVSLLSRLFYTAAKSGEAPAGGKSLPVHPEVSRRAGASASCRSRSSTGWAACSPSSKPPARSRRARPGRSAC